MNHSIVRRLKWLGDHLAKCAEAEGIGQGSEGARMCWEGKAELERLEAENAELVKVLLEIRMLAAYESGLHDAVIHEKARAVLSKVKDPK